MAIRYFRNAPATTLVASISGSDTVCTVADASGFPTVYPYTVILDKDQPTEEVVDVISGAGNQLTISRGADSTTAFPHNSGAVVAHGVSARDFREANTHVNATGAVHGVVGDLVGTTDAQTLTSKTITSSTFTGTVADSAVTGSSTYNAKSITATADTVSTRPLTLTGILSQTADMIRVQKSDSTNMFGISSVGRIGVNTGGPGSSTGLWIKAPDPADTTVRITAQSGQTTPLLVVANSSNAQTGSIGGDGTISFTNIASSDFNDWQSYVPAFSGHNGIVTSTGRWRRIGRKTVAFTAMANFTGAGSGSSFVQFQLPTTPNRTVRTVFAGHAESPFATCNAVLFTGGSGTTVDRLLFVSNNDTVNLTGSMITATTILTVSGVYEEL